VELKKKNEKTNTLNYNLKKKIKGVISKAVTIKKNYRGLLFGKKMQFGFVYVVDGEFAPPNPLKMKLCLTIQR
jgi:hypothetical protein